MRSQLLASLTSKLVAGVAATTLAAGSAGAVVMTTISSENDGTQEVAEQVLDGADAAVDCDADGDALPVFEEEIDTDTAEGGEVVADPCDDDSSSEDDGEDDGEDPEGADTGEEADAAVTLDEAVACAGDLAEAPNFGSYVDELRHECGYQGGVSELAHEKNRLRKEARAAEAEAPAEEASDDVEEAEEVEDVDDPADDDSAEEADADADEEDADEEEAEAEEDAAPVTTESADAPGAHGKGHAKKK